MSGDTATLDPHLTDDEIEQYALGLLTGEPLARVREHLASCPACREIHETSTQIADEVADEFERIWKDRFPDDR